MVSINYDSDDMYGNASFYNLTNAVGYVCPNMTDDVKVVQFFLKRLALVDSDYKPTGTMVVDGKFGPVTRGWVIKFQMRAKSVKIDGIVDRAGNANNPSNWIASISKTVYTIRSINNGMRQLDTEVYKTLTVNSAVPEDVRKIFLKVHATSPPMTYGKNA